MFYGNDRNYFILFPLIVLLVDCSGVARLSIGSHSVHSGQCELTVKTEKHSLYPSTYMKQTVPGRQAIPVENTVG